MKLFRAYSKLKIYYDMKWRYSNVNVFWNFYDRLVPERLNGKYIEDYKPGCTGEQAVSELFTAEEAVRLQQWLRTYKEDCTIEEVELPMKKNTWCHALHHAQMNVGFATFALPGLSGMKVEVYNDLNMSDNDRVPVAHDFIIASADNSLDAKCFYCDKEVIVNTHYCVLIYLSCLTDVDFTAQIYSRLCDDCSLAHAPELYSSLRIASLNSRDVENISEGGSINSFGIQFSPTSLATNKPCAICKKSTPIVRPFSILGVDRGAHGFPICETCAEIHVPHLLQIVKQFYASGADKNFLKRYEQERTSMEYGIFKDKILDGLD